MQVDKKINKIVLLHINFPTEQITLVIIRTEGSICACWWTIMDSSHLNNCFASNHLQDLPTPLGAIGQGQVDNLSISWELDQRDFTTATQILHLYD